MTDIWLLNFPFLAQNFYTYAAGSAPAYAAVWLATAAACKDKPAVLTGRWPGCPGCAAWIPPKAPVCAFLIPASPAAARFFFKEIMFYLINFLCILNYMLKFFLIKGNLSIRCSPVTLDLSFQEILHGFRLHLLLLQLEVALRR